MGHNIFLDYFLLAFMANLGVLQMAAAYAGIKGLSLFNRPVFGYLFGAALIAGGFVQFFVAGGHSPRTIIEGSPQFALLIGGAAAAIAATVIISSVIKLRVAHSEGQGVGLEALKETTYLRLIVAGFRRRVKR